MKFIRYALTVALLSSGGLFAATTTIKKPAKNAKYKKIESKKQTHQTYAKKEPKSTAKDRYGKTSGNYKKMEMKKHEKGLRKPTTKSAATKSVAKDRPEAAVANTKTAAQPTAMERAAGWLGLGAAGTAATAAVARQKDVVHHTGPRKEPWHHNFHTWWKDKGFEIGVNPEGNWVFGSYRPEFWEKNYPTYWKDVVEPLYKKSDEYKQLHTK
jgi:hypothetical protein